MSKDIFARGMILGIQKQINNGQTGIDAMTVKVDSNDDSPGFLSAKINGIDKQTQIKIIDNTLIISLDDDIINKINDKSSDGKINIDIDDTQSDYLINKLLGTKNKINISKNTTDINNKLILNVGQDIFDKTIDNANSIIYNKINSTLISSKIGDALDEIDNKSEINKNDISNNTSNIITLQNNEGKIKLNIDDTSDYLNNKIDNSTIKIENNKLVVKTIKGLDIPVETINLLQGVSSNIQEQINGFTQAFHLLGSKGTYAQLSTIESPNVGDAWIINADENNNNIKDWYTYTSNDGWVLMGVVEVVIRDFTINPINLNTEVTGILSQNYIDLTGLVKQSDMLNYLDKNTYDNNNNGKVDNAENSDKLNNQNAEYYTCANNINVDVNNFSNNLTKEDNTVQKVLDKVDKLTISSGGEGGNIDLSNYYTKDQVQTMIFTTSNEAKAVILNSINDENLDINNTFAEVSNAILNKKQLIVEALQNKGISSATKSDELSSYAGKINNIIQNTQIKNTKLNKNQGDLYQVALTHPTDITNIATSILEYTSGDTGIVQYDCGFDNTDSSQFKETEHIIYDGTMYQELNISNNTMTQENILDNGIIYNTDIDKTLYRKIDKIEDTSDTNQIITITSSYNPTLVLANDDINLNNVDKINSIIWTATCQNNSKLLLIFSIDSGVTWLGYDVKNKIIQSIDINNNENIEMYGLKIDEVNNLSTEDLSNMRNGSSKIRFGYYFNIEDINDIVKNDEIKLTVDMKGTNSFSKNVDIKLEEDNQTITYTFNKAGTYTVVYMDNA